mmetsp:Transcript_100980/g.292107  ORF Transcript_100980/g.292107 Transcript_100980/m.292107 type:complete len:289 (+) Transcript_100980:2107-2973(+)
MSATGRRRSRRSSRACALGLSTARPPAAAGCGRRSSISTRRMRRSCRNTPGSSTNSRGASSRRAPLPRGQRWRPRPHHRLAPTAAAAPRPVGTAMVPYCSRARLCGRGIKAGRGAVRSSTSTGGPWRTTASRDWCRVSSATVCRTALDGAVCPTSWTGSRSHASSTSRWARALGRARPPPRRPGGRRRSAPRRPARWAFESSAAACGDQARPRTRPWKRSGTSTSGPWRTRLSSPSCSGTTCTAIACDPRRSRSFCGSRLGGQGSGTSQSTPHPSSWHTTTSPSRSAG